MMYAKNAIFGSVLLLLNYPIVALSQGAMCGEKECTAISCGKTVICESGNGECTMLEGDYSFFKMGGRWGATSAHHSHVYTLDTITASTSYRKGFAVCIYTSRDGYNEGCSFTSKPTTQVAILENIDPSSPDFGWNAKIFPNNTTHYTCDATKFPCQMYY